LKAAQKPAESEAAFLFQLRRPLNPNQISRRAAQTRYNHKTKPPAGTYVPAGVAIQFSQQGTGRFQAASARP